MDVCVKCLNSKSVNRYRIILTGKIVSRYSYYVFIFNQTFNYSNSSLLCQKILE